MHSGLGQQNTMAVIADGSTMIFYINGQKIDQEQDSSYASGNVGLIADTSNNPTDVAYNNARVWKR